MKKGSSMANEEHEDDEWTLWWNSRMAAMEQILGESDNIVGHGVIPFQFGAEMGGTADIVYFRQSVL